MDLFDNLALGFSVALTLQNVSYALIGCVLGTLIGVLPGLGPSATIAMLLPSVYMLDPAAALIMLAGIYYGSQYGGSTTAILVKIPGEASSVVTVIDGHEMARQGRAGPALAAAGLSSFFAGCVGTVIIAAFAPPLVGVALKFGPAEYCSLMVLGLICATVLASGSLLRAVAMVILGLLVGQINTDVISGTPRYSFGIPELMDGLNLVAVAMGIFAFTEIMINLSRPSEKREAATRKVAGLWPTKEDFKSASPAVIRGTLLGSVLGVLPGGGALLSSFASYAMEKKLAGEKGKFGAGDIRGVAGPEAANNAGAQTSFIPMLTLGIPSTASMALMVGAMIIKGIQPGPLVMTNNPELFWGLIASMWVGNVALILLNLPLIGIWVKLLTLPYRCMFPSIMVFCIIGLYTLNTNNFDIYVGALFAVIGYVFYKLRCEAAPFLLGFILGPMMEENLRRALLVSHGDWTTFVSHPISASLLIAAFALLLIVAVPALKSRRQEVFAEHN